MTSILLSVLKRSAAAAATAAMGPAAPVAGAAAGAFAEETAERLLGEFLNAQESQLARVEALNRELQGQLLRLEAGIDALRSAPIQKARLHVEEARRDPSRRTDELTRGRDALFEAWANAEGHHALQAVAGEQLSVVYALLRDVEGATRWLVRSYKANWDAIDEQVGEIQREIEAFLDQRPTVGKKAAAHLRASPFVAGDGLLLVTTWGLVALLPVYRRRLKKLPARQKARVSRKLHEAHVHEMEFALGQKIQAVLDMEKDANAMRAACLELGAPREDVPGQSVDVGRKRIRVRRA
jgi:TolA-binding protein